MTTSLFFLVRENRNKLRKYEVCVIKSRKYEKNGRKIELIVKFTFIFFELVRIFRNKNVRTLNGTNYT